MKIAFAGSPAPAAEILLSLAKNHQVVAVLTKEDAPIGRKRLMTASAVATAADSLRIPILKTNRPEANDVDWLVDQGAELVVVVAYGALLTKDVLAQGLKFINLHYSLLPKYRGAAPVQAAILNGDPETGVTVFEIDQGMDTGPILAQERYPLNGDESTEDLIHELGKLAIPLLEGVLSEYPLATPQSGPASLAPKLSRSDGRVQRGDSILKIWKMVRALSKEPGVWMETSLGKLGIIDALEPVHAPTELASGSTETTFQMSNGRLFLTDASGFAIPLAVVQPEGRSRMTAIDWWRGLREAPRID